jgi:hypothetical protein
MDVNNELQEPSSEDFRLKFKECLSYAIDNSKNGAKDVFVPSILGYRYTPYGKGKKATIMH